MFHLIAQFILLLTVQSARALAKRQRARQITGVSLAAGSGVYALVSRTNSCLAPTFRVVGRDMKHSGWFCLRRAE
jgi:uncharacterized membrane protein